MQADYHVHSVQFLSIHGDIYVQGQMATDDNLIILSQGDLKVTGRLVDASNATLYATATHALGELTCIYKPIAGERPLWDFADGSLAHREYAAYLVSEDLGFHIVPLTILRDGPYGFGMVQEWITIDEGIDLGSFFSTDHPQLRMMALFDAIINNTDRKIGHLLPLDIDQVLGCDHGVTFHPEDKLRTVLWQWAGSPLVERELSIVERLLRQLNNEVEMGLLEELNTLITPAEIQSLRQRCTSLLTNKTFPEPNPDWPHIPWPPF